MILLSDRKISVYDCPYLEGKKTAVTYFFAEDLSAQELSRYLSKGWRKFSRYYFKDNCTGCKLCVPIRIPVHTITLSKSQKRILKKNEDVEVYFRPLSFRPEIYEIYRDHSEGKFQNKDSDFETFLMNFFVPSAPALQSEYYIDGKLAGVGFLDQSGNSLSSVYFIYKMEHAKRGLGTFSVLKEIEYCVKQNYRYYYLGYFIENNEKMNYKNRFYPHELMDWKTGKWNRIDKPE
ncbi:MAG TPA: arginyltransferase [Spirochaetia bacterium]|nr:MAG: hypothetical protein A2Y41_03900 [Spirochaetes bacterium GWB1_36_13]HCL57808.1 arginyltransferase [Spirochaetia bacterium]